MSLFNFYFPASFLSDITNFDKKHKFVVKINLKFFLIIISNMNSVAHLIATHKNIRHEETARD